MAPQKAQLDEAQAQLDAEAKLAEETKAKEEALEELDRIDGEMIGLQQQVGMLMAQLQEAQMELEELQEQLKDIKSQVKPHEILLVVDAMTGQDAVNVAESFNNDLAVDGLVMTKLDGDSRGGAALSVKAVTG